MNKEWNANIVGWPTNRLSQIVKKFTYRGRRADSNDYCTIWTPLCNYNDTIQAYWRSHVDIQYCYIPNIRLHRGKFFDLPPAEIHHGSRIGTTRENSCTPASNRAHHQDTRLYHRNPGRCWLIYIHSNRNRSLSRCLAPDDKDAGIVFFCIDPLGAQDDKSCGLCLSDNPCNIHRLVLVLSLRKSDGIQTHHKGLPLKKKNLLLCKSCHLCQADNHRSIHMLARFLSSCKFESNQNLYNGLSLYNSCHLASTQTRLDTSRSPQRSHELDRKIVGSHHCPCSNHKARKSAFRPSQSIYDLRGIHIHELLSPW